MKASDTGLALTLYQPWASAIVEGPKRIENRSWPPPEKIIGRRIWIHAGKTYDKDSTDEIAIFWPGLLGFTPPMASIVGSCVVVGAVHKSRRTVGDVSLHTVERVFLDPWFSGPYGWIVRDPIKIRPVECRGYRNLWFVPPKILSECRIRSILESEQNEGTQESQTKTGKT